MTLTRWKLLAGILGISIIGLISVSNPQCLAVGKKDARREVAPPGRVIDAVPDPIPSPESTEPKTITPTASFVVPTPAPIPTPAPAVEPVLSPLPSLPPTPVPTTPDTPAIKVEAPAIKVEAPALGGLPVELDLALPTPPKSEKLPEITTQTVQLPGVELNLELPKAEQPKLAVKPVLPSPPAVPKLQEPPVATPKPQPVKVEPTVATPAMPTVVSEPAVRVQIHLSSGQPEFAVMSGEDVLLKAVCNNIDIHSPSANGAGVTPLKAGGKVRFSAPGCHGQCDNLTVLPTTGEVELAGNVKVHCRMGKGETEIHAATLKFKLGSAPAYSVPSPDVTPVSTFNPSR